MTTLVSLTNPGWGMSDTIVMRRAPAAAAPTLDSSMTAPATAAIRLRHPLRNAPLRSQPANIRMAASPSTARRITHLHNHDPPPPPGHTEAT